MSEEITSLRGKLITLANPKIAENYKKYLKSPYNFYGIRVPELRKIAKEEVKSHNLSMYDAYNLFEELWNSGNHDEMNLALFIIQNFKKKYNLETWKFLAKESVLSKLKTWDHVDALCTGILGHILAANIQLNSQLKEFSNSRSSWIRRVSIVSQYPSIKKGKIQYTISFAEKLCYDSDVYVQKATGWMLREAAKKNHVQVKEFLKIHRAMKAVCMSYATEKMPDFKKAIKAMKEEDKNPSSDNSKGQLDSIKYFKN